VSVVQAGLAPARTVLGNGLTVVAKETRKTPAVSLNVGIRAGSIVDPPDAPGATYLLSRVIDRGTRSRSAAEIAEALDDRGISLSVVVTRHLLTLYCTCLAEDFDAVMSLVAEIVTSPTIPESELATRKGEVITLLRQDEDNPAVRAVEALMELLYGPGHPYGRRQKGTGESVALITREQLVAMHAARFAPGEVTAVVVGDVDPSRATEVADRAFGGWRTDRPAPLPLPPVPAAIDRRRLVIPMMNKAQADIAYGFTTITRADPAYPAFWLMNNVLGQYALGGRLGDSIRERQGMAYYVSSVFDPNIAPGPLVIRAGVGAANVERAIASIDEEVALLCRDGITQKEIDESRQYLIGSLPRALETNAGIAQFLQTVEFFGLGLDHDLRLPSLLSAVGVDDVNAAGRRVLDPARATVVVAGPYQA
jgi:zinc protease